MICFRNLALRRGGRVLLENVNWKIFPGQHTGLTGANGCGKSSLFSLLLGELSLDAGTVEYSPQLCIAHVAQEMPVTSQTALEFVLDGDIALRRAEQVLESALAADDGFAIAHAHDALHAMDAFSAPARAARLLEGLGFKPGETARSVNAFSGGWQMRLLLAKALMCRSDLLLLDEPTNHLDLDAVIWLTRWLKNYTGTLLMISHDRDFLDETVQQIAHIENHTLEVFTGNYSESEKQRAEKRHQQAAQYRKQQLHIAKCQQFINRFRAKASKAKQAQSRLKALERLEMIAAVQEDSPFDFQFRPPAACPHPLLQLDEATVAFEQQVIFAHLTFTVSPGDRIALIGPNGAGKSTLIRALAGELSLIQGERIAGPGLQTGYFAQHHVDHLQPQRSPLEHLALLAAGAAEREQRSFLGSFGFVGERVHDQVKSFSGGEKSRLALALLVWQKPNLLLLDEPTNHLDMAMRDALVFALQTFSGAMVLVSHDRFLLRSTVDQLVLVADGKAAAFSGDLPGYEDWLTEYRRAQTASSEKNQTDSRAQHQRHGAAGRALRQLESRIKKLQQQLQLAEAKLADPALQTFAAREKLQAAVQACEAVRAQLHAAEESWLQLAVE